MTRHRKLQHKIRRGTGQQARRARPRRAPTCEYDGGGFIAGQCTTCGRSGTQWTPPRRREYQRHMLPLAALRAIVSSAGYGTSARGGDNASTDRLARPAQREDRPASPRDDRPATTGRPRRRAPKTK